MCLIHSNKIQFSLVENAQDSINQAIDLLAWKESKGEGSQLKRSILSIAHAVELLLKERLRRENPALIWEDVDKYPSIEARTVTVDKAISRLRKIVGVNVSESDERLLKALRNTRNAIEHFEWHTTVSEAKLIVGSALSFALHFASENLGQDLAYEFKRDDTWQQLISELTEFSKSHGERIQQRLMKEGALLVDCEFCAQLTVSELDGTCGLCGHWNNFGNEIPF